MPREVWSSSQNCGRYRLSRCMKQGVALLQPIWTARSDEIVSCVSGQEEKEEMNEIVKALLNMFLKHGVDVLFEMLKQGP